MRVQDEVAGMRIVHCALRSGFPGIMRVGVIGIGADKIDVGEALEGGFIRIHQLAANDEVKELDGGSFAVAHGRSQISIVFRFRATFGEVSDYRLYALQ